MFINATTRQQISIYSIGPYLYLLACTPTFGKVGVQKIFFSLAPLANPVLYPHLKIRGAAHVYFYLLIEVRSIKSKDRNDILQSFG